MSPRRFRVDIVIPVLNEAHVLEKSVYTVRRFLEQHVPHDWRVVIVDNGSSDGTGGVAQSLAQRHSDVRYLHLDRPGRGRALRFAWQQSHADAMCYMDVDLSTDLACLPPLLDAVLSEEYDVATGSRLLKQSQVRRTARREIISQLYNLFLKIALGVRFSDAQCGFKAVSRRAVAEIVPLIEDQSWFFDTELLVLAQRGGYRIKDIPVVWIEDDDSRVKIVRTAWEDIKGVLRLRRADRKGPVRTPPGPPGPRSPSG